MAPSKNVLTCKFTISQLHVRLLQSGAAFMYWKLVQMLLQSGAEFLYWKAWQVVKQSRAGIKSGTGITKRGQLLQNIVV